MPFQSVILHLKANEIQDIIKFLYRNPPNIINMNRALQNLVKINTEKDKNLDIKRK